MLSLYEGKDLYVRANIFKKDPVHKDRCQYIRKDPIHKYRHQMLGKTITKLQEMITAMDLTIKYNTVNNLTAKLQSVNGLQRHTLKQKYMVSNPRAKVYSHKSDSKSIQSLILQQIYIDKI